ncbi:MAG: hypothetical protein ACSI46_14280 [Gloeotrichia echinulata DVL01]
MGIGDWGLHFSARRYANGSALLPGIGNWELGIGDWGLGSSDE